MKKRILSIILAAIMVVSLFPVTALAEGSQMKTDSSVASVKCDNVTTYYDTVAEAFNAANSSTADCEITILKECSHSGSLTLKNSNHVITLNTGEEGTVFTIKATAGSQNLIQVQSHVIFTGNGGMITADCHQYSTIRAINVEGSSAQIDTYDGFVLNIINGGGSTRGLVTINYATGKLYGGKILCPKANEPNINKNLSTIVCWTNSLIEIYGGEYHWYVEGGTDYWAGVLDCATNRNLTVFGGYFDGPLWWSGSPNYNLCGGKFTSKLKSDNTIKDGTVNWDDKLGSGKHSKEISETYNGTEYHYEVYDENVKVMNVDTHKTYDSIAAGASEVNSGETLKMLQDISENVTVASGKDFTLDLSGHVLSKAADDNSSVITVEGNLTVIDSVPTASHAGYVDTDGLWHLGAKESLGEGEKSILGGIITGGVAENGGGVKVNGGQFTMTSGTIAGNTSNTGNGGGVYLNEGSLTLGGTVQITGSTAGSETKTANNLYLSDGKTIDLGTGVAAPTTGMLVGVTMQTPGKFTTSGKKAQEVFFASDVSQYVVKINNNATTENYSDDYLELSTLTKYTVSFDTQGHGTPIASIKDVTYGSTITKPTDQSIDDYTFCGWYVDTAFTQMWNFENDRVRANMTLHAKWVDNNTISTVSGILKDDAYSPSVVTDATVKLMKGDVQWDSDKTDSNGKFNFKVVPAGTYQIVVEKGGVTTTALVVVDDNKTVKINGVESTEESLAVLTLCNSGAKTASSDVEVKEDTPDVIVGGLEEIAKTAKNDASNGDNIKIKLQVESKPADTSDAAQNSIKNMTEASGKKFEFIDMSLLKQINGGLPTDIGGSNTQLLTIVIPFDFSKVKAESVMLLRKHVNNDAEIMTKITVAPTGSSEGYLVDELSGTITVYAKKFSTYAIAYDTHTHDDITFKAWTKTDSLPSEADLTEGVGSYYLTGDVTLGETWNVPAGTSDAVKTTNLCLNGCVIRLADDKTGSVIKIENNATLNIFDCNTTKIQQGYIDEDGLWHLGTGEGTQKNIIGGCITGGNGYLSNDEYLGGGVYVASGGTLVMNGGTIAGCSANKGGGVFTWGNMTMNGSSAIIGCTATVDGGGVCACNCSFTMKDSSSVSNCKAGNGAGGVYICGINNAVASFTMYDSSLISGCEATATANVNRRYGGGVCVEGGKCTFTMNGGTITGNKATNNNLGGGVYVYSGTFNMNKGSVAGNMSKHFGGGVYVDTGASFTMTGGSIDHNTATQYGGGVYTGNDITLGGEAKIIDNVKGGNISNGVLTDGTTNNVFLLNNKYITLDDVTKPTGNFNVGVTTQTEPSDGSPVKITTNGTSDDTNYFKSDNDNYYVRYKIDTNGYLELVVKKYNVTAQVKGDHGTATVKVGEAEATSATTQAAKGTSVAFTANPNSDYEFDYWEVVSGSVDIEDSKTNNPITVTMPATALTLKAHLKPSTIFNIIVEDDGHGTAKAQVNSSDVTSAAPNASVTLTATPSNGYAFKEWKIERGLNEGAITDNKFTMPANEVKVKAIFEKVYTVEVEANGHGSASADSTSGTSGTEVNLTITPDDGYEVDQITVIRGGVSVYQKKFTIGTADVKIQVTFKAIVPGSYSIIVEDDGHGTAKAQVNSSDVTSAAPSTSVTLIATPSDGYTFKEWVDVRGNAGDFDKTNATTTLTMPSAEIKVKANFERVYNINLQSDGHADPLAYLNGTDPVTVAKEGNLVTLSYEDLEEGYEFDTFEVVSGNVTFYDAGSTFIMPAENVTIRMTFKKVEVPKPDDPKIDDILPKVIAGAVVVGGAVIATATIANMIKNATIEVEPITPAVPVVPVLSDCDKGVNCPLSQFSDLNAAYWYHDGIHFILESGLMKGIGDNQFNPNGKTTRPMMMTILARMDGNDTEGGATWDEVGKAWAKANGISEGIADSGNITREEFATMLYRYAQLNGQGFTGSWMFMLDFKDADKISDFANEAVHWCVMKGILNGKGDGMLDPQGELTRAEAAAMIQRYFDAK